MFPFQVSDLNVNLKLPPVETATAVKALKMAIGLTDNYGSGCHTITTLELQDRNKEVKKKMAVREALKVDSPSVLPDLMH